ncbi:MAG: RluA family pseudouridine synthase, partial [Eubacteriales bacterium]|nr:RluA family pseudouridine synthase [Eubacteriales bacterium]
SDETISNFKEEKNIEKTKKDFKIILEDNNIIICYKPVNLVSQPDKSNPKNSLNDQLLFYLYEKGEYNKSSDFTPSICNRLDKNTSGIVIFGKNFKSLQDLNKTFKEKTIDKY